MAKQIFGTSLSHCMDGCKFEVDEMFVKIGNKEAKDYLTYAIEQNEREVIGFRIGTRTKENIKSVIDKILLLNPKRIYTVGLNI